MSIADVRRNGGSIFVLNGALDLIGNTPMVDVSILSPNPNVRLVAKLESPPPGRLNSAASAAQPRRLGGSSPTQARLKPKKYQARPTSYSNCCSNI